MPVTVVKEVIEQQRRGRHTAAGKREYTRVFAVHTSGGDVSLLEVLDVASIPQWGDPYRVTGFEDATVRVVEKSAVSNRAHDLWLVTVTYSSEVPLGSGGSATAGGNAGGYVPLGNGDAVPPGGGPGGGELGPPPAAQLAIEPNPLLRKPSVRWSTVKVKAISRLDANQVPILNSAGEPFDPPLEYERTRLRLVISQNRARFDVLAVREYCPAVNSVAWLGLEAGRLLLEDFDAEELVENGVFFVRVNWQFLYDHDGWDPVAVLDAGYNERIGTQHVRIVDKVGSPVARPALLDGTGRKLAANAAPVYREFHLYEAKDFKDLKIF